MAKPSLWRRLRAPFMRMLAPGYGCCHHCGWPWKFAEEHMVRINDRGGFFFACEDCWTLLTPTNKVNYAAAVVHGVGSGWRRNEAWAFRDGDEALMALVKQLMAEETS